MTTIRRGYSERSTRGDRVVDGRVVEARPRAVSDEPSLCLIAYDEIAGVIEAKEREAGIAEGSWRYLDLNEWVARIMGGYRARARREECAGRGSALNEGGEPMPRSG